MNNLRQLTLIFCALISLATTSCDKIKDLTDGAKSWISDEEETDADGKVVGVQSVDKTKGQEIISSESRLVMVEYYSDT